MEKKHKPSSDTDDVPMKPLPKRKPRKKQKNMADIVNKIIDSKRKEIELKRQQELIDEMPDPLEEEQEEPSQTYEQDYQPNTDQHQPTTIRNVEPQYLREFSPEQDYSSPVRTPSQHRKQSFSPFEHPLPAIESSPVNNKDLSPQASPPPPVFRPQAAKGNTDSWFEENVELERNVPRKAQTPGPARRNFSTLPSPSPIHNTPVRVRNVGYKKATPPKVNTAEDWQSKLSITESNRYMLVNEINCDVTFLVDDGSGEEAVMAHSYVLMSRSSKFYQLMAKDSSAANKLYSLTDVSPSTFRDLLMYIYTDQLDLNMKTATNLIPLASKFSIGTLRTECFRVLLSEMGSENVCSILELAHLYGDRGVQDKCSRFVLFTAKDVLRAEDFKNLCKKCLDEIVSCDELNADEVSVYNALMNWAKCECSRKKLLPTDENKRKVLQDTLFHVRFCLMDVKEFTKHVSRKTVLTSEEKIALFQYFHGETDKLPTKFHHTKHRRFVNLKDTFDKSEQEIRQKQMVREPDSWPQQPAVNSQILSNGMSPMTSRTQDPNHSLRTSNHSLQRVSRFSGVTGSWKVTLPDAISFRVSLPIYLYGVQVYGPYKETATYKVYLSLYDEFKNTIREECRTVTINKRNMCDITLSEPVRIPEERLFTLETVMKGDQPTLRGTGGLRAVSAEGIMFSFSDSSKSVNGTDVTTGQLPTLLFRKAPY